VAAEGVEMSDKVQVWSCGGGTQSCAIAALIVQGKLPKPDISVIADTGYEKQTTWDYMNTVISPALQQIGIALHRVLASEYSYCAKDFNSEGTLLIPAFTDESGQIGKLGSYCNAYWKRDVVDRWLSKVHSITRSQYTKWIGFSRDEVSRALRMMKGQEFKDGLIRFPLINDAPMTRQDAQKAVEAMGWPTPPRSACWKCPNMGDHEWREIKENRPEEFAKAVAADKSIRAVDPHAWLHKSCKPLDQVDFSQPEDLFSRACDSGMCFV
jgi:hypothetical protein